MATDYSWLQSYPTGTVVAVWRGLYRHVGILCEPSFYDSERCVISLNPGAPGMQLRQEAISVFARGMSVEVASLESRLHPHWVLARARSGQHPSYSLLHFNCDHFVRFAHGLPIESPQLRAWGAILAVGALVVAVSAKS